MTQTSYWWTTSGTPTGHQVGSYTQAHLADIAKILGAAQGQEGVIPNFLSEFDATVPSANTVRIQPGAALVDGKPYSSDANVDVTIPSTTSDERIDRIVLRASWASFQVTITRIEGTESASPTAPAITQTPGTTYDIMLYQARVNSAGTVTITDERVISQALSFLRQGGNATNWDIRGTNNYTPIKIKIQAGVAPAVFSNQNFGGVLVTFPEAFSAPPIVLVSCEERGSGTYRGIVAQMESDAIEADDFQVTCYTVDAAAFTGTIDVQWLAIGPA